jgi:hypothetical protein
VAIVSIVLFALLAAWGVADVVRRATQEEAEAPPGKVWSAEHGHWHDVERPGTPRPEGPALPGKEWSEAHGHWHDIGGPSDERPPGPAPAGKVWSEEHGHWHDAAPGEGQPVEKVAGEPSEDDGLLVDEAGR